MYSTSSRASRPRPDPCDDDAKQRGTLASDSVMFLAGPSGAGGNAGWSAGSEPNGKNPTSTITRPAAQSTDAMPSYSCWWLWTPAGSTYRPDISLKEGDGSPLLEQLNHTE